MRSTPFMAALLLAALTAPATAAVSPKTWSQEWNVGPRPDVHVTVDDAHVRVHAGPDGTVKAKVDFGFKRWGLVFGLAEPVVVFERKDGHIWVNVRGPRNVGVVGGYEEHLNVDVTVPAEVVLSVRTGDGAIDCEPLAGQFTFETGDGAVRGHGLKGGIEVSTGDGRIILDDLDGKLRARTGDGRMTVAGRFDLLDLGSNDGRIEATARRGSQVKEAWNLQAGDGAVALRIPDDTAALLDARTRDGRIHVQLPIPHDEHSPKSIVGELNGGGPRLRVRTADGSITLGLSE